MAEFHPGAEAFLPDRHSMKAVREASAGCRVCGLYREATQTVFGQGRRSADLMLVGETPGDREDLEGRPFVGPAGRELDQAFAAVGLDRRAGYGTNAVKHVKVEEGGKRGVRKTPPRGEGDAGLAG